MEQKIKVSWLYHGDQVKMVHGDTWTAEFTGLWVGENGYPLSKITNHQGGWFDKA